jgi:LPS export ABC transporter protein LptC
VKRLLFFLAFMALGTGILLQLLVSEPGEAPSGSSIERNARNQMRMTGVAMRQLEGERLHWELWAETALFNEKTSRATLEQVRFRVYETEEGKPARTILHGEAGQATLAPAPGELVLEGAVRVFQGLEVEIRSERLEYDPGRQRLHSPVRTWVRTPSGIQQGESLLYSIPDQKLSLTGPVLLQ